jgi:tRNA-splicing ligase RtcB (3'-phosphate/5'-hydroxy nucleic acid ligase)
MKTRDVRRLGFPGGECAELAKRILEETKGTGRDMRDVSAELTLVAASPKSYLEHEVYGGLAQLMAARTKARDRFVPRQGSAPYRAYGDDLEAGAVQQMDNACRLPVAVAGALMPDAHQGYGLPIGGVLATDNAVIPYAVGVDIACRMKLSVLDLGPAALDAEPQRLTRAIESETKFGVGAEFSNRRQHAVMDADWAVTRVTRGLKDKAWRQLGTSGSGNHFVEFGVLEVFQPIEALQPGVYLALLSHSGSRGSGASVADHYSRIARELRPELPQELGHLAWLDLESEAGQEYWAAMELMGAYAAANHELIHHHVAEALGATVLLDVENHHNFAWRERHVLPGGEEREVIVHRKGATPAGRGVLGIIPGSMAAPGYVVRGRGSAESLRSASHGAGRRMSRTQAKQQFSWADLQRVLKERGVTLLSAGLDEVPMAYKDIDEVMAAQRGLVDIVARFDPKLVKMAPGGERPED